MTQILAKSTGGVLQIPAAATQKSASTPAKKPPKPATPRLKLLVRRLPPGLTQEEFDTALGPEWKIGAGKVDWYSYKLGKVSKDPAKPSRPARAYIHVVSSDHIIPLSDKVRGTAFIDARNTASDPVLLGPPSVEFAPYAKIPGSRVRKDARQGTIDQDPEFITFLESLTQPIPKPAPVETADGEEKKEAVTITPLVQYIKDKKANKAKEASSKSSKHKSNKEEKPEKIQSKRLLQRPDKESSQSAEKGEKRSRADKATKEAVKAANKAAGVSAKQSRKASSAQNSPKDTSQPTSERKRERGNVSAAAKILQRDLGLAPAGGRRKGGKAATGEGDSKGEQASTASSETNKKDTSGRPPKGGAASQNAKGKRSNTPQPIEPPSSQRSEASTPAPAASAPAKQPKSGKGKQSSAVAANPPPTSTATQAFLKHANPSQGVTEPLLEAAFSPFGKVVKVEIDKKKGFGYVDFAEPEGLQKAVAASPVSVAQSQVVVLERKMNPSAEKGRGKGRNEAQSSGGAGNSSSSGRGGKSGEPGSGGNNPSSRGPRGGRGSKNKGSSKGNNGGGNANSNPPENKGGETK